MNCPTTEELLWSHPLIRSNLAFQENPSIIRGPSEICQGSPMDRLGAYEPSTTASPQSPVRFLCFCQSVIRPHPTSKRMSQNTQRHLQQTENKERWSSKTGVEGERETGPLSAPKEKI
ncbi:hypothetical protein HCH54_000238 [Aspergillus fumigatus]